jgi:hypothetical protein
MNGNHNQAAIPLDGNAVAGLLRELFACEVTVGTLSCNGCGAVAELGAMKVFGASMGAIFRCTHCGTAVMRFARTPAGLWLDMRGASRLFVPTPMD